MNILRYLLLAMLMWLGAFNPVQAGDHSQQTASSLASIAVAELPPEGRDTLKLIKQGGPFPYDRDGIVFGNFEGILPKQVRGYYHEYTVPTPGARTRGARRIISGKPGEYYYTADHYQSFKRIKE